ncbi:TrbI/VirB10 family protein [Bdellovibrionota bacterium FG-1]
MKRSIARMTERNLVETIRKKPGLWIGGAAGLTVVLLTAANSPDEHKTIFQREGIPDFKNASILGNPGKTILKGEEQQFSQTQRDLIAGQKELKTEVEKLHAELQLVNQNHAPAAGPSGVPIAADTSATYGPPAPTPSGDPAKAMTQVQMSNPAEDYGGTQISGVKKPAANSDTTHTSQAGPSRPRFGMDVIDRPRSMKPGSPTISFPVKTTGRVFLHEPGIVLPSGSYVRAKLLTGVEAPEGKSYPVLMQLDFAYVIPNHKRLDLAGCFIIAKAQGDLSTERVQMQATKLSCVSKSGGMFEREVNGFIADDADNSFAVMGSVNTKQDRVAATAFLAGVVSGIGKAIQQAQTTQQTTPLGGSQSVLTGDQAKYIGAGGASEAATMVTQWYLKQAQNLLPTINVGSGQDVWIVMQDQVDLPRDYFAQNESGGAIHASVYSHFTKLVD